MGVVLDNTSHLGELVTVELCEHGLHVCVLGLSEGLGQEVGLFDVVLGGDLAHFVEGIGVGESVHDLVLCVLASDLGKECGGVLDTDLGEEALEHLHWLLRVGLSKVEVVVGIILGLGAVSRSGVLRVGAFT